MFWWSIKKKYTHLQRFKQQKTKIAYIYYPNFEKKKDLLENF